MRGSQDGDGFGRAWGPPATLAISATLEDESAPNGIAAPKPLRFHGAALLIVEEPLDVREGRYPWGDRM